MRAFSLSSARGRVTPGVVEAEGGVMRRLLGCGYGDGGRWTSGRAATHILGERKVVPLDMVVNPLERSIAEMQRRRALTRVEGV